MGSFGRESGKGGATAPGPTSASSREANRWPPTHLENRGRGMGGALPAPDDAMLLPATDAGNTTGGLADLPWHENRTHKRLEPEVSASANKTVRITTEFRV